MAMLAAWLDEARAAGVRQPEAMTVASVDEHGDPDARTVLLRGLDARGVVFYTNLTSTKGRQLQARPRAAAVLHWREQERQVRITGAVEAVAADEADAYWATRPRGHRISALASPQSEVVGSRAELEAQVAEVEARFAGAEPPRPGFWGGLRIVPVTVEFWQGRADRLHDRVRGNRTATGWLIERLAP